MITPSVVSRYWHTLRWLRPSQVYGRLWFRLYQPRPDLRAAPSQRPSIGRWQRCARAASMTGPSRFNILGEIREITTASDWSHNEWPRLWLYNAHYFDDLAAHDANERREWHGALVARWIAQNNPGKGIGWEPYPTSLRIVNWVKWVLAGNHVSEDMRHSLAIQARWLRHRLEIHLLGNHLWANAKALVFAGACFEGDVAETWRRRGLDLLQREIKEQILKDGGHFERSPMYHAIVLEDVLDLIQLAQRYPSLFESKDVASWRDTAGRMLRWLRVMTHPDGGIAFFNDAALGIAPDYSALAAYARTLNALVRDEVPLADVESLPESGYVRLQAGPAVLLADVGSVGPDYQPGHAHAGTLSFEMSLCGRRVLVNGGTSGYEPGTDRLRQRGTAAHNTVQVDRQNSSEVWNSFRVARRARAFDVHSGRENNRLWLEASHDGYRRLPGRVIHRRRWSLEAGNLSVEDMLEGEWREAEARFHFAPDEELPWRAHDATGSITAGTWHPRFGVDVATRVLSVRPLLNAWTTVFSWNP